MRKILEALLIGLMLTTSGSIVLADPIGRAQTASEKIQDNQRALQRARGREELREMQMRREMRREGIVDEQWQKQCKQEPAETKHGKECRLVAILEYRRQIKGDDPLLSYQQLKDECELKRAGILGPWSDVEEVCKTAEFRRQEGEHRGEARREERRQMNLMQKKMEEQRRLELQQQQLLKEKRP
jgi:hypothetical protein